MITWMISWVSFLTSFSLSEFLTDLQSTTAKQIWWRQAKSKTNNVFQAKPPKPQDLKTPTTQNQFFVRPEKKTGFNTYSPRILKKTKRISPKSYSLCSLKKRQSVYWISAPQLDTCSPRKKANKKDQVDSLLERFHVALKLPNWWKWKQKQYKEKILSWS